MPLTRKEKNEVDQQIAHDRKSMVTAYALWLFFGVTGVHRLYLGMERSGMLQLILFVLSTLFLPDLLGVGLFTLLLIWVGLDVLTIPDMITTSTQEIRQRAAANVRAHPAPTSS